MINNKKEVIAIVGIGYVGLPLAIEFSKLYKVIGFDKDKTRISQLNEGYDCTDEVSRSILKKSSNLRFVNEPEYIKSANIYIITVPTPVDKNNIPDLNPLETASSIVGSYIQKNDIVIYESTVFPGCTEEICVPILERYSGLVYNSEFFCGYSPERINPGDKDRKISNIKKITSGSTKEIANYIDSLYSSIIDAGTFQTSSMMVAEAAKVIENTQRDVNIALINELSLIFDKMDIDTTEVLEAAGTKWNFLPFKPGLVGGHCIGVDPYYLTYKAAELGYHPEIILAGRKINDNMGYYIAENTISELAIQGISPIGAKIAILGFTFKENCPDLRNTKVLTIIEKLKQYQCSIIVSDSRANSDDAMSQFRIELLDLNEIKDQDAIIVAVAHDEYYTLSNENWSRMLNNGGVLIDVKSIYAINRFSETTFRHWRL